MTLRRPFIDSWGGKMGLVLLALSMLYVGTVEAAITATLTIDDVAPVATTWYASSSTYTLKIESDGAELAATPDLDAITGFLPTGISMSGTKTVASDSKSITYTLSVETGVYSFTLLADSFEDTDSIGNMDTTFNFKVGFAVSSIGIKVAATDTVPSEVWLVRTPNGKYAFDITVDTGIILSNAWVDYNLAGIATSSGITIATFSTPSLPSGSNRVLLPVSLTNTLSGTFTISIPNGAICTASKALCNADTDETTTLKVGFSLTSLEIVTTTTDTTSQSANWLSRTTANTYALILGATSTAISTQTADIDKTAITWSNSGTKITLGTAASGSAGNKFIKFPLDFTQQDYGTYAVTVAEGAICSTGTGTAKSCNTASTLTKNLKIGFDVTVDIIDHTSTDSVLTAWLSRLVPNKYDTVVTATDTDIVIASATTVGSAISTPGTAPLNSASTSFTLASDNTATVAMSFTTVVPGKYTVSAKQGQFCTASSASCNAVSPGITWKIGFDVDVAIIDSSNVVVTNIWQNPATAVVKAQISISTPNIALAYTSSNLPGLSTVFSETTGITESSKAVVTTSKFTYTLSTSSTSPGTYVFDVAEGKLCNAASTVCNAEKLQAVRLRIGYGFDLAFVTDDSDATDVTDVWLDSDKNILLTLQRTDDGDLAANTPSYTTVISSPGLTDGSTTTADTGYAYQIETGDLVPGQYTITIKQGGTTNEVTDTTDATYAANYEQTIILHIGFNLALRIVDSSGTDISNVWIHPESTFGILIVTDSPQVAVFDSAYSTSAPDFADVVEGTPAVTGSDGVYRTSSSIVTKASIQYSLQKGLDAGDYSLLVLQGSICNGLSALSKICNAEKTLTLHIGWVPDFHITDGTKTDAPDIEAVYDADQTTVQGFPIPSFTKDIVATVGYDDIKQYSGADLTALTYSSIFVWPEDLDNADAPKFSSNTLRYEITSLSAKPGMYEITLVQGKLSNADGSAKNAAVRIQFVLGVLLSLYTVDGSQALTSRGAGISLTRLQAVRLRMRGVADDTLRLIDIIGDVTDADGKSSASLVGGRFLLPVAATDISLDYALDLSALVDGVYTAKINETAPIKDTVQSNLIWQAQSFDIIIDRTNPEASGPIDFGIVYIGRTVDIDLPTNAFTDAFSSEASLITVVSIDARDLHGLVLAKRDILLPFTLANTVLRPSPVVRGPPGPTVAVLKVMDEAGNTATTNITFQVVEKLKPKLTIVDARGASSIEKNNLLYTGGGGTAVCANDGTCSVGLSITATYPTAVNTIKKTDLLITGPGGAAVGNKIRVFDTSTDGRKFLWSVTITGIKNGASVYFSLPEDITRYTKSNEIAGASNEAQLKLDLIPPTGGNPYVAEIRGTALIAYNYNISCQLAGACLLDFFTDDITAPKDIYLSSSSPSNFGGVAFYPGTQGIAYMAGVPLFSPNPDGYSEFEITGTDAAGNTATRKVQLYINEADSAVNLVASKDRLSFFEGDSALSLHPRTTFSYRKAGNDVLISGAYIYLSNAAASNEAVTSSALPPGADEVKVRDATTGLLIYGIRPLNGQPDFAPSAVERWIQKLQYTNTNKDIDVATRTVRLEIMANGVVIASTSRPIFVTAINQPPVLTGGATVTYNEPTVLAKTINADVYVFSGAAITDVDDTLMSLAVMTIVNCDNQRDELYLQPGYIAAPRVRAVWSAATCVLVLRSVNSPEPMTIAEIVTALKAVRYTNKDTVNPTNRVAGPITRQISAFVQDIGSNEKAATLRSVPLAWNLVIKTVDDPPVYIPEQAFVPTGVLSSTDPYANIRLITVGSSQFKQRVFPVFRPSADPDNGETTTYTVTFTFDLTAVKDAPGYFAKGAIFDPDTNTAPTTGVDLVLVTEVLEAGLLDVANELGTWWNEVKWEYNPVGLTNLTITIDSTYPDAQLGPIRWRIKYASALDIDFWIDVRQKGCVLLDADNYVLKDLTTTMVPSQYYPDNVECKYTDVMLTVEDEDLDTGREVDRGGFIAKKADMAKKVAALDARGVSIQERIPIMAEERANARGTFKLGWTKRILDDVPFMPLSTGIADGTKISLGNPQKDITMDTSLVLKLGPAGAQFINPIRVCVFVGDTGEGLSRVLFKASQVDPNDISKGYTPWKITLESSFDPVTGEVCGGITSFSIVASGLLVTKTSPTVSKAALMSSLCPNLCHAQGFCRPYGICQCFPGFEGPDCSLRVCPTAPSWSTNIPTDILSLRIHDQAECSGAGLCDRETGLCKCFDNFEGAACERVKCPNDCSNNGRCRLLKEFPAVQRSGYASWEIARIGQCICDSGYTGEDCSERLCAFGDDVETVCAYNQRQVQRITLDFFTVPAGGIVSGNEFALRFRTRQNYVYTTPRITNIWDGSSISSDNIANALLVLPRYAITGVEVSVGGGANTYREYLVTFTGDSVDGDQHLLECPVNSHNVMGCPSPGCQPRYQQLKLTNLLPTVGVKANFTASSLENPVPLDDGDELTPFVYAAEVTVTVYRKIVAGNEFLTYEVSTVIYGKRVSDDLTRKSLSLPETPLPMKGEPRIAVPLLWGLRIDMDDDDTKIIPPLSAGQLIGTQSYTISWRLPTCNVEVAVPADKDLESEECGRRGICNRGTGLCECFEGYTGPICNSKHADE